MRVLDLVVTRLRDGLARVQDTPRRRPARAAALGPRRRHAELPRFDGQYVQPDQTSCGSSTLVMSRMINDPEYARSIETGADPSAHSSADSSAETRMPAQRFADEALAMHRRTNRVTGRGRRLQMPWPRMIGTQPWAVAAEMSARGGSGVPGARYHVRSIAPRNRGAAYDRIEDALAAGHTVPLYVGNTRRPGHVVLAVAGDSAVVQIYDPASGRAQRVTREEVTSGRLGVSGWDEPWFVIVPKD